MKLVGLMPVRNEDWVLGLSARVALQWCDVLVVYLHACEDRSQAILREVFGETKHVHFIHSYDPTWNEMPQRETMLKVARDIGATHIAMIDADEVLTANLLPQKDDGHYCADRGVRDYVAALSPGQMLELPGYNLRGSLDRYHSNGIWGNRWFSCAFKDQPEAHWAGDKFHSRNPAGVAWRPLRPIQQGEGGILHLWGASERRLRAKHALYKVTERLRWPEKKVRDIEETYNLWRSTEDVLKLYPKQWGEPWEYATVPKEWWDERLEPWLHVKNPEDLVEGNGEVLWQEAEVCRLVQEHGPEKFKGLDLFGL